MRISIETYTDDGDLRHLLYVDWPVVPAVGTTVSLTGPQFGDDYEDTTHFEVAEVVFAAESRENAVVSEDPSIIVSLPRHCTSFTPQCTCHAEDRAIDTENPTRCANCGDRYPTERRRMLRRVGVR